MMKVKTKKNRIVYLPAIAFFGIFYTFLPLAGDDWAWGSDLGIERLNNAFDGYNGRYVGNLLILLITRSVVARVIICTLTVFLLIFILGKIFDGLSGKKNSPVNFVIAFSSVLILVLPNQIAIGDVQPFQIFGSTIGWLSGFTNYVVPSALILTAYYFLTNKGFETAPVYVFLLFDGFTASLCVEHYTLFCVLFGVSVAVYRYLVYKKICKKSISFFTGALIGAFVMFSNSAYRLMQSGDVSQKQRAVGFMGSFKQYANYIFPENTDSAILVAFEILLILAVASFLIFFFIKTYKAVKNRNTAKALPVICMVVMTLPLLFTNSGQEIYIVAPRCYFLQYFMLVIFIYRKLAEKKKAGKTVRNKKFHIGLKLSFTALLLVTGIFYFRLDSMGAVRENTVNKALEEKSATVEIIAYPKSIEHIQWSSNFINLETYLKRYKDFKNIPENKEVEIISWSK